MPKIIKKTLLVLILMVTSGTLYAQTITIGDDNIVRCKGVSIGTKQTIDDIEYEVVDIARLIAIRNGGGDLTNVCVSNVTDMSELFQYRTFNQNIGNWDVSSVTDMSFMFEETDKFNQPIGNWDVSTVTNMREMFYESDFNQPVNLWCVPNFISEPVNFSTNSPLTQQNKPVWGTCIKPEKLTQLYPQNNSTDVLRNVELGWKSDSLSTHYQIQIAEGVDPIVIDTLISDTLYSHTYLFKDQFTYYWRVRSINYNLKPIRYGDWSEIWKFTTLLDTSIESEEHPTEFSLHQNYPNPFNPNTQIQFSLPQTSHIQLEVYSLLGQRITTLINGTMSGGDHTVPFDGKNLSSGIYIYRLTTPEYSQSRLMNLLK